MYWVVFNRALGCIGSYCILQPNLHIVVVPTMSSLDLNDTKDDKNDKNDEILRKLYYDKHSPLAFANKHRLFQAVKGKLREDDVDRFLARDRIFTSYRKRPPKNFRGRQVISPGPWNEIALDLADLSKLSVQNGNKKWLLVAVDVFSRYWPT